jgi:cytochrome d ubiquinol oxidase subunit I
MAYWTFRGMVGSGMLMLLIALVLLFLQYRNVQFTQSKWFKLVPFALVLPYLANTTGWLLTEMGRQPWIVFGLMKTADAVSPNLTVGMVLISLIGFTLVYGVLMGVDIYLLAKFAKAGPSAQRVAARAVTEETYWE